MKKLIVSITLATLAITSNAQTNLFSSVGDVFKSLGISLNPTNEAYVPFGGMSLGGGQRKYAAGFLFVENVNNYVGVVGGIDHLWGGGQQDSANLVSGGLTLKTALYPIREISQYAGLSLGTNTWAYNLKATPYAVSLVGTPVNGTSNNGGACLINRAGADIDLYSTKSGWNFGVAVDYGNRSGAGNYSGNYIDIALSLSKGF